MKAQALIDVKLESSNIYDHKRDFDGQKVGTEGDDGKQAKEDIYSIKNITV